MSVLVDANLLVYAALPQVPEHRPALTWLAGRFADDDEIVGLAWTSLYAFVRLVSNRRILGHDAVPLGQAWSAADAYRRQVNVVIAEPGSGHAALAKELFSTPGLSTNDVPDVYLAAVAIERGLTLATHDHGFARFHGLRWMDPLA